MIVSRFDPMSELRSPSFANAIVAEFARLAPDAPKATFGSSIGQGQSTFTLRCGEKAVSATVDMFSSRAQIQSALRLLPERLAALMRPDRPAHAEDMAGRLRF